MSAVAAFQLEAKLTADGVYGQKTHNAMMARIEDGDDEEDAVELPDGMVEVTGSTVNIRAGAGTSYDKVGIVRKGDRLQKLDLTGWIPALYNGQIRFISEKYVKTNS